MVHFLAENKTLVLLIALNVLLAVALSVLLYLVYPQFVYDLESVSNAGDGYSVRTYTPHSGFLAYFEVLRGHRRIYSYSGEQQFIVKKLATDVTGNGLLDLVVQQWDGSAHEGGRYLVLEIDNAVVHEIAILDGLLYAKFEDLNKDGVVEVIGVDGSYDSLCGDSRLNSPRPRVVLLFDKTQAKFIPDKKSMSKPPFSSDRFRELSLEYKNDARWQKESRPPVGLFVAMFDLIYSGNEKQAWELFEAAWPDGSTVSKEEYRGDVKAELNRSPYYRALTDTGILGTATIFGGGPDGE